MYKFQLKTTLYYLALIFLTISLNTTDINAQRFKGSAVLGLNFSQIDGDDLAGFNKVGLTGGFKLDSPLNDKWDMSLEMLYSKRGSSTGFGFGGDANLTSLQYLSVPILVSLKDWYIKDEDYHKVSAHGGLDFGYMFSAKSTNDIYQADVNNFKKVDISLLVGINYKFTRKLGLTIRYTRSYTSLLPNNVISYFITIRTEYSF